MNQSKIVKEQLLHLLFGVMFFMIIGAFAVTLDLLSSWVVTLHVSSFTSNALAFTAHAMLVLDLVLFCIYLLTASISLIREMTK